jgi:hypothetical protein
VDELTNECKSQFVVNFWTVYLKGWDIISESAQTLSEASIIAIPRSLDVIDVPRSKHRLQPISQKVASAVKLTNARGWLIRVTTSHVFPFVLRGLTHGPIVRHVISLQVSRPLYVIGFI